MDRCYPTGCPPCDGPIDFPENPSDGQRYCIPIGSEGNTKCWVWDACVPAWRAEGPSESSTRFRGSLDVTQSEAQNGITRDTPEDQWLGNPPQPPNTDLAPGDWWILTADSEANQLHPDFADNLRNLTLSIGDRIFYDGNAYERLAPPVVPYAEEAVDINPLPDNRTGGITLNASLQDTLAGTKKCDAITPYTLSNYVAQEIGNIPAPVINDGQLTISYNTTAIGTFTANQAANTAIDLASVSGLGVPVGTVIAHASRTTPAGFLKCNGALVSNTTYADLFASIGTAFGSGAGTFRVPDLRGNFMRGWTDGSGVDSGRGFGTTQGDDYRSHNHASGGSYSNSMYETPGASNIISTSQGNRPYRLRTINAGGGNSGGSETRPRNIALQFYIKY